MSTKDFDIPLTLSNYTTLQNIEKWTRPIKILIMSTCNFINSYPNFIYSRNSLNYHTHLLYFQRHKYQLAKVTPNYLTTLDQFNVKGGRTGRVDQKPINWKQVQSLQSHRCGLHQDHKRAFMLIQSTIYYLVLSQSSQDNRKVGGSMFPLLPKLRLL